MNRTHPIHASARTITLAAVLLSITLPVLKAQSARTPALEVAFEAASIKRSPTNGPTRARLAANRFTATNAPPIQFLQQAYDTMRFQIVNAPDWTVSERYDLDAKAPDGVSVGDSLGPLLLSLLKERFKLEAHVERREMPTYDLIVERKDRRLGERLQKAQMDCSAPQRDATPAPAPQSDEPLCAMLGGPGRYTMRGYPMSRLARMLSSPMGRTVVDKTGLTGPWNVQLEFTPDSPTPTPGGSAAPPAPNDPPTLTTALQEQLGLKLESSRGTVDVIVIDRIERPTEN